MLKRSVLVVHYESNSTNGWTCLHCIVSVITRCSVLSASCRSFPACPINYLIPLHQDFINSAAHLRTGHVMKIRSPRCCPGALQFD